jgi:hypothetical protein
MLVKFIYPCIESDEAQMWACCPSYHEKHVNHFTGHLTVYTLERRYHLKSKHVELITIEQMDLEKGLAMMEISISVANMFGRHVKCFLAFHILVKGEELEKSERKNN